LRCPFMETIFLAAAVAAAAASLWNTGPPSVQTATAATPRPPENTGPVSLIPQIVVL
ncbi:unnamed protein product, partial [Arctogadus glacialis]